MTRSPLKYCTSIIRSSALVQASSGLFMGHTRAWPRRLPVTEILNHHFSRKFFVLCTHIRMYFVHTYKFDWCCFYYFVRNSLVALLEALCARIYVSVPRFSQSSFFGPSRCLIPTPGLTSEYPICAVCVGVCVYTHIHPYTLPPMLKTE